MAITVEIATVDRTSLVHLSSGISWTNSVNSQGQASFVIRDFVGGFVPDDGMDVVIKEDGTERFGGRINGRPRQFHGPDRADQLTWYKVSVGSHEIVTNKRRVRRVYTRQTFEDIVADINTTFLSGEGITLNVAAGSVHTVTFNGETVSEALDILCELEADDRTWQFTAGKVLTIETITTTPAPATLDNTTLMQNPQPTVTPDRSTYANTVTVTGGGPDFQKSFTARDTAEITARATAEPGSSGIYEYEEERPEAKTDAAVEAIAEGILAQRKVLRQSFKGSTRTAGFAAGQEVTIDFPNLGLSSVTLFIESVSTTSNEGATAFIHAISAITGAPGGGWQAYYRREKKKPRTIPMQIETAPGLVRVEPEGGPLVHDPTRDPMEFFQGDASGTLDEGFSGIGIMHRRISGSGSGNFMITVRRGGGSGTGGCGGGLFPGYLGGAPACFPSRQTIVEKWSISPTEKVDTSITVGFSWDEFAANGNFKSLIVIDPTSTYAAVIQYGAPGTLIVVSIAGGGIVGSVDANISAQGNLGEPVWTTDGYLYAPNIGDEKIFIYDLRIPSSPIEVGSFATSLSAVSGLVASSDEAWLYGVGTGGFVSLDRANPEVLVEDTALVVGAHVSCDISADDSLIGAAIRVNSSNVRVATVAVDGGNITTIFNGNLALSTGVMSGIGAILEDGALIVFNQTNPSGINTLKAHIFNLVDPAAPTFTETLSYNHGVASNIGPAKTVFGRKVLFVFGGNADAQITFGVEAFDKIVPYTIGGPNRGPLATQSLPPRMGGSGLLEGQRGNIEVWTGRQDIGVIAPPARSGATLAADFDEAGLWKVEENDIHGGVEIDDTDSPYAIADGDDTLIGDTDAGEITADLPALALSLDRRIEFKNTGASGNDFILDANSAELIEGAATLVLSDGETAILSGTSVQWEVVGGSAAAEGSGLFLRADGTVPLTDDWDAGDFEITTQKLAAGTAPGSLSTVNIDGDVEIKHTAAGTEEHALDLIVDAAGFGEVRAIDIDYITGPLAAGSDEAVTLVNIDESAASGGDVTALAVLATEGLAKIVAVEAGALVHPIEQLSGVFIDADTVDNDGSVITTLDDGGAGGVDIFTLDNDFMIVGSGSRFEEIEYLLATDASGAGIAPTFEFSTGIGAWSPFSPIDGTNAMRNSGVIAWLDSDIPSWATGAGTEFLIRITRTRNTVPTPPVADKLQIAATTEYFWDKAGDIKSRTYESDVATGTPPLAVASPTVVPILNVDQVDGKHETAFSLADGSRAFTGVVVGVAPTIDLHLATKQYVDDGDALYYTQAELDAGQLDNRYYTETELDADQLTQYALLAGRSGDVLFEGVTVFINDTTNVKMTTGLTMNMGTSDNFILDLKSSDVAHEMTSIAETDTFGSFAKAIASSGGFAFTGYTELKIATLFKGIATIGDTTKSTDAEAPVHVDARKRNGTGSGAMGPNENCFVVDEAGSARMLVDEDGDIHSLSGAGPTAFDEFDDVMACRALTLATATKGIVRTKWDEFVRYNEQDLISMGILGAPVVSMEAVKRGEECGLVNITGLQRLHNGAIWQLYMKLETQATQIATLEQKLLEA